MEGYEGVPQGRISERIGGDEGLTNGPEDGESFGEVFGEEREVDVVYMNRAGVGLEFFESRDFGGGVRGWGGCWRRESGWACG